MSHTWLQDKTMCIVHRTILRKPERTWGQGLKEQHWDTADRLLLLALPTTHLPGSREHSNRFPYLTAAKTHHSAATRLSIYYTRWAKRQKLWSNAPWFCSLRLWRFISHLLTYLLTLTKVHTENWKWFSTTFQDLFICIFQNFPGPITSISMSFQDV